VSCPSTHRRSFCGVLQEREIERIGGTKTIPIDVRIICATNRNLEADVLEKRSALISSTGSKVFPIYVPPLRERREDVTLLVNDFVRKLEGSWDMFPTEWTKPPCPPAQLQLAGQHPRVHNVLERPRSSRAVGSSGSRTCPI